MQINSHLSGWADVARKHDIDVIEKRLNVPSP